MRTKDLYSFRKLQKKRAGGGVVIDPGIHLLDLARHLIGEPHIVHSEINRRFWNVDVEDDCNLLLRSGGADISVEVSLLAWKSGFGIEVVGSDGIAIVSGRGGNYGPQSFEFVNRWFWNGDDRRRRQDFGTQDPSFERETEAFLRWIGQGTHDAVLSTADDGVAALKLVTELYGSQ